MFRYCLIALFLVAAQASTLYEEEVRVADKLLGENPKDNLKYIRPPGEPTNVTVNFYVRKIFAICEEKKIWKVQLTFRQEWTDTRLQYTSENADFKYLPYGNTKDIWTPDTFFADEIESDTHEHMQPNTLLRIHPDGHVVYSTRITLTMYCPVDFHSKEVHCPMRIASYGFTSDELHLGWKAETPAQFKQDMELPGGFSLKGIDTTECDSLTTMGKFSCINADFKFSHDKCHV